jgi:anti-anti-sigma regulatory factor
VVDHKHLEVTMSITMRYINLECTRAAILRPTGALDRTSYTQLIIQALVAREDGVGTLIVDLHDVTSVGTAGLVGLYALARLAQGAPPPDLEAGWATLRVMAEDHLPAGRLAVVNPRPPVRQALARGLFAELLIIHADVDAALAALAA